MFRLLTVSALVLIISTSAWSQGIYYSSDSKIRWVDSAGGPSKIVAENKVYEGAVLAADASAGKLYRNFPFSVSNLDGSGFQLIDNSVWPTSMAFDYASGKVYFSDHTGNIYRSNLNGSNFEIAVPTISATTNIHAIAVDPVTDKIFWAGRNGGTQVHIYRADLGGVNQQFVRSVSVTSLTGMAIDPAGQRVYWGDNGAVGYADFGGGMQWYFHSAANHRMAPIVLRPETGHLYWVDGYASQGGQRQDIYRSNLDGTGVSVVASYGPHILRDVTGLAFDSQGRYYLAASSVGESSVGHGVVERINSNGSGRTTIAEEFIGGDGNIAIDEANRELYVASGDQPVFVSRMSLAGAEPEVFNKAWGFIEPGIIFDTVLSRVFWSKSGDDENCNSLILQQPADGFDFSLGVTSGCGVELLAVDGANSLVYYVDDPEVRVVNAAIPVCCESTLFASIPGGRRRILMDLGGGQFFHSSGTVGAGELQRTSFGGASVSLIAGLSEAPELIQLEANDGKLYWVEGASIRRANVDGSGLETIVSGLASEPRQLTVDSNSGRVFWLIYGETSVIGRANLDGSDPQVVVSGVYVSNFAVDRRPVVCERTEMFADITGLVDSVEFQDISAVVDVFRGVNTVDPLLADLYPCDAMGSRCLGDGIVDFRDISLAVNAFRGIGCQ